MARTLDEVIRSLPLDQQQDIEARAARLIEEEMTLRDLRKAQEFTQARIAEALHISQDGVSRIERRSDFLLSTLRSYVEAMGGSLRHGPASSRASRRRPLLIVRGRRPWMHGPSPCMTKLKAQRLFLGLACRYLPLA